MTELAHEHEWTDWQPFPEPSRDGVTRESRWCVEWPCGAVQIRPVLDTALGRCQTVIQCHLETGHAGVHEARERDR
jgi:hypothetical protein